MSDKPRLDELLVERGFFEDTHAAQAAVLAGDVVVGEHRELSAGKRLKRDVALRVKGKGSFVSRGGQKLQGALDAFGVDPAGLNCADLGASSGGFTDCLLKAGAAHVSSIDVNYGQFAWSLRNDPRVSLHERTNVRGIDVAAVGGPFDLVVGDLSFVSIESLLPDIFRLVATSGQALLLVKPQFEVAPEEVGEGGIVRDPALHTRVLHSVVKACTALGLQVRGVAPSPIKGTKGNVEFLLWAMRYPQGEDKGVTIDAQRIEEAVREAHEGRGGVR